MPSSYRPPPPPGPNPRRPPTPPLSGRSSTPKPISTARAAPAPKLAPKVGSGARAPRNPPRASRTTAGATRRVSSRARVAAKPAPIPRPRQAAKPRAVPRPRAAPKPRSAPRLRGQSTPRAVPKPRAAPKPRAIPRNQRTIPGQVNRARRDWPWIRDVEDHFGLPHGLLHAVGSRETGLRNIVGDRGHGHGVWQLDDRSHPIPPGFDGNVRAQADVAGQMLHDLGQRFHGDWRRALNTYNSGQPGDRGTTGHNYGPDVLRRLAVIQRQNP